MIYLTFDAGYENGNVEKTLDILRREDVPAAFFILGNLVTSNTDLVKRMIVDGHLICNHTYSHKDMTKLTKLQFEEELQKMEAIFTEYTGEKLDKYYRPPEGRFSVENIQTANELGYKTFFWSFAYADWDNGAQMKSDVAMKKILDNLHNGEIMLLHPTSKTNAEIMRDLIRKLKQMGYKFATLEEL